MIVVYGLLCNTDTKLLSTRHKELKNAARLYGSVDSVEVLCNGKQPRSMTYDIWKRLVQSGRLLEPTQFVLQVIAKVCRILSKGDNVILVGHSYGGSVAARVGLYLKDHCSTAEMKRLKIATLGSIFIPPPEVMQGINIRHYTYRNDVALACSRAVRCNHVTYLTPRYRGPIKAHMDYQDAIVEMAQKGSTRISSNR